MLCTEERIEILSHCDELINMIKHSDLFEQYKKAFRFVTEDKEAQRLIKLFLNWKEKYEEVQRFGRYHPDYKEVIVKAREAKRDMDMHFSIARFRKIENAMQELLDEISVLIGHSVSEYIKVPTGNPHFLSGSCQTGCASGGACGCK